MATAQKTAPKFGGDYAGKVEAFEILVFERLQADVSPERALTLTERSEAMFAFGWTSRQLNKRLHQLDAIREAQGQAGKKDDREKAEASHAEAIEAQNTLAAELSELRHELDKRERKAATEVSRLGRLCDGARAAVAVLRDSIPEHVEQAYRAAIDHRNRGSRADLHACLAEIRHVEVLLAGPQYREGEHAWNSELQWIGSLRREDRSFVTENAQGGYDTTPAWDAAKEKYHSHLAQLRVDAEALEQQVAAETAEIEEMRDYYVQ